TVIHATVEEVRIGEICELLDPRTGAVTKAEVVGLMDEMAILVPLGDLTGLSSLTEVIATGKTQTVPVGPGLLGRVISAFGEPLDGKPLAPDGITGSYPVNAYPPSPLERSLISEPI
ncbi:MAG: EscN/YscN/HrcN family type III secretion system ATPase, partial [Mesorhizobium sp.]